MPYVKSTSYLGYCVPNILTDTVSKSIKQEYKHYNITTDSNFTVSKDGISGGRFFDETMADTYVARHAILAFGVGGALVLGFLYLTLLRIPGNTSDFENTVSIVL